MAQTITVASLTAEPTTIAAKIQAGKPFIPHHLPTIPNIHSPLFSAKPAKPISAKPSSSSIRANPPQKFIYPDPNPEFAVAETQKFKEELMKKLSGERETFGDELSAVVNVCTEIFGEFLHKEYGGPGTLLVEPFTDMMVVLKEQKLPGAPLATRASLLWAQNFVDQDWEIWNSTPEE